MWVTAAGRLIMQLVRLTFFTHSQTSLVRDQDPQMTGDFGVEEQILCETIFDIVANTYNTVYHLSPSRSSKSAHHATLIEPIHL